MAIAAKERAEYEDARREMEREREEYLEAQRVAEKERREAVEARKRMEERKALHLIAECILSSHSARDVANRAIQVCPCCMCVRGEGGREWGASEGKRERGKISTRQRDERRKR